MAKASRKKRSRAKQAALDSFFSNPIDLESELSIEDIASLPRDYKRLAVRTAVWLTKSYIDSGRLDPAGKTHTEIVAEVRRLADADRGSAPLVSLDYTDGILRRARSAKKADESHWAVLFYAIWFEHKLNSFIALLAGKRGLSAKHTEVLIKETRYAAKGTALLCILGMPPLSNDHMNNVVNLMELRNSFVHYKWKPEKWERQTGVEKQRIALLDRIEKTVKYLQYFERKYLRLTPTRTTKKLLMRGSSTKSKPN
jgi:hypothetical protein